MVSKATRFTVCLANLLLFLVSDPCGRAAAAPVVLSAFYDPVDGSITMKALDSGAPASLDISTFQFLSPGLLLSGSAAAIPSAAASFATVLNTSTSFVVTPPSVHAEIYATNFGGSTALFTSTWNLGPVAAVGLSQAQINAGFTTDPDITPGGLSLPGSFVYQAQGTPEFQVGYITAVPEPSASLISASACVAAGLFRLRRRLWKS